MLMARHQKIAKLFDEDFLGRHDDEVGKGAATLLSISLFVICLFIKSIKLVSESWIYKYIQIID